MSENKLGFTTAVTDDNQVRVTVLEQRGGGLEKVLHVDLDPDHAELLGTRIVMKARAAWTRRKEE